jgi:hypothetical protein
MSASGDNISQVAPGDPLLDPSSLSTRQFRRPALVEFSSVLVLALVALFMTVPMALVNKANGKDLAIGVFPAASRTQFSSVQGVKFNASSLLVLCKPGGLGSRSFLGVPATLPSFETAISE